MAASLAEESIPSVRFSMPSPEPPQPLTPTVDQPLPECIGRYRLLGRLGVGGMGTVYRAQDPHLDRIVALKVPRLDGPGDQRAARVQRFQREARAAARILHPHVCPIFDVGEHEGSAFVVMAYVEGPSLAQVLAKRGRLDVREAVTLAWQILDALSAVHANGIVHRDVKPGNILLDSAGRAILTDFGLARPEESGERLTSEGAVVGTPAYMAPEQAAGQSEQVGPWTDLYAVGVVLYQMLTGRLPFEGPPAAVLGAVVRDEPPSPRQYRPELDPGLEAIVLHSLRKDPRSRFVDAREFIAALAGVAIPAPSPASVTLALPAQAEPGTVTPSVRHGWVRRRLLWLGGAVCVAGAGLLIALVVLEGFTARDENLMGRLAPPLLVSFLIGLPVTLIGPALWSLVELSWSPRGLWYAARSGWTEWVRAAARRGVPLDCADELGETALMQAAANGHTEVVKVLLLHGVDVGAVSSLGQTALEIAYARGHHDIVALLQKQPRQPRPPGPTPGPQPSARRWLLASALVGAALGVVYSWATYPWPTEVLIADVVRLAQDRQVKSLEHRKTEMLGTVTVPQNHPWLRQGRFHAVAADQETAQMVRLVARRSQVNVSEVFGGFAVQPPYWSIGLMLGIPVLLAGLVGWPLGASQWFPILRAEAQPGREGGAANDNTAPS
jgi:hypothetical protein